MATALMDKLPKLNGEFEIGIAASTDPGLPTESKLSVGPAGGLDMRIVAMSAFVIGERLRSEESRIFVYNAAMALAQTDWICSDVEAGTAADGDWRSESITVEEASVKKVIEAVDEVLMKRALTVIVATKINWWQANHHTGQGSMIGYCAKVCNAFEIMKGATEAERISVVHMVGHWASTRQVLSKLGIAGITPVYPINKEVVIKISAAADMSLRLSSCPAGTHRHAVSAAAIRRIRGTPLIYLFPDVPKLAAILSMVSTIKKNPVKYHVGAGYLCGQKVRDFSDNDAEGVMGRLGTYVTTCIKNSTLAKSPHFSRDKVQSYEDYSSEFASCCAAFMDATGRTIRAGVDENMARDDDVAELRAIDLN